MEPRLLHQPGGINHMDKSLNVDSELHRRLGCRADVGEKQTVAANQSR